MVDACKAKNLPEPYYEIRPDSVAIVREGYRWRLTLPICVCTSEGSSSMRMDYTTRFGLPLREDNELTAVIRSRQLHIYRNGKKVLILAGKAAPKVLGEDRIDELL